VISLPSVSGDNLLLNSLLSFFPTAPLKGLSSKLSSAGGGFLSPSPGARRASLLGSVGTSIGGTPNRMSHLKKEGGIKV